MAQVLLRNARPQRRTSRATAERRWRLARGAQAKRGHAPQKKALHSACGRADDERAGTWKRSKNAVSPPVERTRPLFTSMPMTSSPHPTTKSTSLLRLREFVWVGGCVTAPTAWASTHWRRRRSVHKSAEMAPRCRFGAFVYTVAPWAWVVGGLGITIVYTNGRIGPLGAVSRHLCTLLRYEDCASSRVGTQECTQIGGNGLSGPFRGICVHCYDASRDTNRDASCLRQVARAPRPPWRVGGASSLAPLAWSGRQALSEWRRCSVGIFAETSTHTNP